MQARSSWKRRLSRLLLIALLSSLGPIVELRWLPPSTSAFMLRAEARAVTTGHVDARVRYRWTDLNSISPQLALAVIAAEDQHFPEHWGFDLAALRSAWRHNRAHARIRGGSTLSQQLAKNLFLSPSRSYLRKGAEAYFTLLLEVLWPKRRILETYLNIAEFGDGVFGAEAASEAYFNKASRDLTANEAALLAAVLPNPQVLTVRRPSRFVRARAAWILRQMRQLGGSGYLHRVQ
ncbi:monofunctional biosynthetic peptidoglycan transglycosylase [Methylolobus aquaticus]